MNAITNSHSPVCPNVLLAKKYQDQDPSGWWMSEKFDGVRAVWDGEQFISRNGNIFHAPDWFKENMPVDVVLDGELWIGRNQFQDTISVVRSSVNPKDWLNIKFMVFDIIADDETFESRMDRLKNLDLPGHCQRVCQIRCKNARDLKQYKKEIIGAHGEGVMLRAAGSFYEYRRSATLLKVKQIKTDEATVIGSIEGKGKHEGRLGALVCEYNGNTFRLGTGFSDDQRKNEVRPVPGDVVTFSFFELTKAGVPRFPSFLAVRNYE